MKKLVSRLDLSYVYAFLGEATLGLTFLFYIVMARVLGPDEYGVFAAAIALGGILSLFIQFGLPALLGREVAADPQNGPLSTVSFLLIEALNAIIVLLFLWPIIQLLGFSGEGILICYLVILSEVCRSAKLTLRNVLRGINEFGTETISVSLERVLTYGLAGGVLLLTANLAWVVGTIILVRCVEIAGLMYYISRKTRIFASESFGTLWKYWRRAYPFALSGVLWVLYYQVDILTLQWLSVSSETGLYSASYRIIEIFSALPRVVFYVTFTRFASCYNTQPERLPREVYKATKLLLVGVLPFIIVAGYLASPLVSTLFGSDYAGAVGSLAILLPSLGIKLFGSLSRYFFEGTGREKLLPPLLLSTVVINIVANIILIPQLGAIGAAIATLLSEIILSTVGLVLMARAGYAKIAHQLQKIAFLSLLAASTPSLIILGVTPWVGVAVMLASLGAITLLMKPGIFLAQTS